jgi:hypothetical protein
LSFIGSSVHVIIHLTSTLQPNALVHNTKLIQLLIQDLQNVHSHYAPAVTQHDYYATACVVLDRLVAASARESLEEWTPAKVGDLGDVALSLYAALRLFMSAGVAHYHNATSLQVASYYVWFEKPVEVRCCIVSVLLLTFF